MHQSTPAAVHLYAAEQSASPNGSGPADPRQAQFGELPQSDLRLLVAAMVD